MKVRVAVCVSLAVAGLSSARGQSAPPGGRYFAESFSIAGSPRALAVGDLDLDGRPDVVASCYEQGLIAVARNVSFGQFKAIGSTAAGSKPVDVRLGDFNGDGKLDVVTMLALPTPGYVLLGDGAGGLAPPIAVQPGFQVSRIAAADVDGDGDCEAIITDVPHGLGAAHWNGSSFGPVVFTPLPGASTIDLADVDGDGIVDVVSQNGIGKSILITFGNGVGGFGSTTTIPIGVTPGIVLARDAQGDGIVDLIAQIPKTSASTWPVECRLGTGGGAFAAPVTSTSLPLWIEAGDVDLDGDADLITSSGGPIGVCEATAGGAFAAPVTFPSGVYAWAGIVSDVDGDGWPEVLSADWEANAIVVAKGRGQVAYGNPTTLYTDTQMSTSTTACFADANADGVLDAISNSPMPIGAGVQTRLGDGVGGFGPPVVTALPTGGNSYGRLIEGDVDGDGLDDVVVTFATSNSDGVATLRGTGLTQFVLAGLNYAVSSSSSFGIAALELQDVDNDSDLDVVIAAGFLKQLGVMKHTGYGVLAPAVVSPTGTSFGSSGLSAADLDGDQTPDLAVVQLANPVLQVLLFKGSPDGTFVPAGVVPAPLGIGQVKFMHLNGDALIDLVAFSKTGNFSSGANLMTFVASAPFQFGLTSTQFLPRVFMPTTATLTDVDGDGRSDFVIGSQSPLQISVFRAPGNGALDAPRNFVVPGEVVSVEAADVNSDERVDFLVGSRNGEKLVLMRGEIESGTSAHGLGCAGSGGFVPQLWIQGSPTPGQPIALRVEDGLGGAPALLLFGAAPANVPIGGSGCSLLVSPLYPLTVVLPLSGSGPGNGGFQASEIVPIGTPDASIELQVLVADPGGAGGVSASGAVTVAINH